MKTWEEYYRSEVTLHFYLDNIRNHTPYLEAILDGGSQKIVEVGVGTGTLTTFLSQMADDVLGVDNDPAVLQRAEAVGRQYRGRARWKQADAFRLARDLGVEAEVAAGRKPFDVAATQGLLEHFSDEDIRKLLREQLRVAKRVVASVPSKWYPQRDVGNERLMTPDEWRRILEPLGADLKISGYWFERQRRHFYKMWPLELLFVLEEKR